MRTETENMGSGASGFSILVDPIPMGFFARLAPAAHLIGPGDAVTVALKGFFRWQPLRHPGTDTGAEQVPRLGPFELLAHVARQNLKGPLALGTCSGFRQHVF